MLFGGMNAVVHAGQKVGLTGANGSGKSSLFAMIQGALEPDTGTISLQQQIKITHVAQETPSSDQSAIDYIIDGDRRIRELEQAIEASVDDGVRHANVLAEYEQAGGYQVRSRAGALLNGLGFSDEQHEWSVKQFSGGWRMRLNLGQALMSPNELLLLDEPTNHLDLDAVLWLEQWLKQREGTLILVSHDREFLDSVTTHTLHIAAGGLSFVTGNYSAFEVWRAARMQNQQAVHEKTEKRRKELQGFVDRFRAKATKARQAQSRLKMLERLEQTSAVRIDSPFTFRFKPPISMPSPLVVLQDVVLGYGDHTVLSKVNLTIHSGDRIGLLGVNGAGKSTLVKSLVGELEAQAGKRIPAQKLKVGYFAQHQVDQLRDELTPLQALQKQDAKISDADARTFLGSFGFRGEQAMQATGTLSGGERARLSLALIVQTQPNLLLLDEPTNHLDIDMRQALADALVSFEGAIVVISHDRIMLRAVVDALWLVSRGSLTRFDDDLDGYARWLNDRANKTDDQSTNEKTKTGQAPDSTDGAIGNAAVDRKQQKRDEADRRQKLAPLRRKVSTAERALDDASLALSAIQTKLGDEALYNEDQKSVLNKLLNEEASVRKTLFDCEDDLLACMQALEEAEVQANR